MNPKLKAMLTTALGVVAVAAGVRVFVYTPQPATRTMAELKDAGILDLQRGVITCNERFTKQTRNRIEANQPGLLRPSQSYGTLSRTVRCFNPDGGNCWRPSDGLARVSDLEGELIIPSLRVDLAGTDGSVTVNDGGDNDDVDDALQFDRAGCVIQSCPLFDADVLAGKRTDPFGGCLGGLNSVALQPAPCMIPNGWGRAADGGWCEEECGGPVDCNFTGPYGTADGGPRWNGFNARPREYAVGAACVPVACGVASGDVPQEWL